MMQNTGFFNEEPLNSCIAVGACVCLSIYLGKVAMGIKVNERNA